MISYLRAARELDARWTGSLQFLPPTPRSRSARDCAVARQIAATEIDLFSRYAREIAAANGLKLGLLVDLYDMLLSTGLMFSDELEEVQIVRCERPLGGTTRRRQCPSRLIRPRREVRVEC